MSEWKSIERSAEKGPTRLGIKILVIVGVLSVVGIGIGVVTNFIGEGAQVLQEEVGPRALRDKYAWFKNAYAQLDKKNADIKVYQGKLTGMEADYEGVPRKDWDRVDKQTHQQWTAEVAGVTASYNSLAAEYNAEMAKFYTRFTNVGMLPQGGGGEIPREVAVYKTQ